MPASLPPTDDQAAIAAALSGNWKEAIKINSILLKENKTDIDSLNRLAYAYLKNGEVALAKRTFHNVLTLDPYNGIALKNDKLIAQVKKKSTKIIASPAAPPSAFLEDPGKTKIVFCVHLAPAQTLMSLSPGQLVYLKARKHAVELRAQEATYIAALPDDIAFKLIKLLGAGNTYQVIVKAVGKNSLSVILREMSRGKRFVNQPSFISTTTSYTPFTPADVREETKPTVVPTGEDDIDEEEGVKPASEGEEETP